MVYGIAACIERSLDVNRWISMEVAWGRVKLKQRIRAADGVPGNVGPLLAAISAKN